MLISRVWKGGTGGEAVLVVRPGETCQIQSEACEVQLNFEFDNALPAWLLKPQR